MPRPMTILAGEGQPGQQVSPIRKQTSPFGVAPFAGTVGQFGTSGSRCTKRAWMKFDLATDRKECWS